MRFATSFAAVMAFAASALAQTPNFDPITKPTKNEKVQAGSSFDITWEPSTKYPGPVSISLIGGKTQDTQIPLGDIASGVTGSSYTWAVKPDLGADNVYGIVIKLESNPKIFQYSFPFQIVGDASGDSTATGGSTDTTVTTAHGSKTVSHSSSAAPTTASATSASTSTSTSAAHTSTSASSTVAPPTTLSSSVAKVTSTVLVNPTTVAPTTTAATTTDSAATQTGAAAAVGAPMALIGGLAAAIFAL